MMQVYILHKLITVTPLANWGDLVHYTDVSVSLPEELTFSELDEAVDICASVETNGTLMTQLTITFTIEEGGTASEY